MVRVHLRSPDPRLGDTNDIDVDADMTVGDVRLVVSTLPALEAQGVPASALRLIYCGRALTDDTELLGNVLAGTDLTQPVTLHAVIAHYNTEGPQHPPQAEPHAQGHVGGGGGGGGDGRAGVVLRTVLSAAFVTALLTNFFRSPNTWLVAAAVALLTLYMNGTLTWLFRRVFPAVPPPPPPSGGERPVHPPRPFFKKVCIAVAAFFASLVPSFDARTFAQQFD